jgi:flagellar motor switch protein FliM
MNFQVGETMLLNATPESDVDLRCGDVTMAVGKMGRAGQHVAIQVQRTAVRKVEV